MTNNQELRAYHNDPAIKEKYINRMKAQMAADKLIQVLPWNSKTDTRYALGCTPEYNFYQYETELGIPRWLAELEEKIFHALPQKDAMKWPYQFLCAINVGADLEKIKAPFLVFVLESALSTFDHEKFAAHKKAILNVMELYKDGCNDIDKFIEAQNGARNATRTPPEAHASLTTLNAHLEATDVANSATTAAYSAAYAGAYTGGDGYPGFEAAAYAAEGAADAAYFAAYEGGHGTLRPLAARIRTNEYKKFANKLIELMRNCK